MRKTTLVAAALLAGLLAGCGDDAADSAGGGDEEPILIGMPAERTGPTATPSSLAADGVKAAAKLINDRGGIDGRRIEIVEMDTEGVGATAIQRAQEMRDRGVVAFVGPVSGSLCAAVSNTYTEVEIPGLCLSPADLPEQHDWMFGVGVELSQIDEMAFEYLGRANGRVGIVIPRTPVGDLVKRHIASSTPDGVTIVTEELNQDDTSAKAQLQKLIAADVGALFIAHCGPVSITAAGEAVDLRFEGKILLYNCFASLNAAESIKGFTNGNIETFAPNYLLGTAEEGDPQFDAIQEYFDNGGTKDATFVAGWDGMHLMAQAIDAADSTDPADILAVLEDDFSFAGAWSRGTYTADDHRGTVTEGALIPVRYTREGGFEQVDPAG